MTLCNGLLARVKCCRCAAVHSSTNVCNGLLARVKCRRCAADSSMTLCNWLLARVKCRRCAAAHHFFLPVGILSDAFPAGNSGHLERRVQCADCGGAYVPPTSLLLHGPLTLSHSLPHCLARTFCLLFSTWLFLSTDDDAVFLFVAGIHDRQHYGAKQGNRRPPGYRPRVRRHVPQPPLPLLAVPGVSVLPTASRLLLLAVALPWCGCTSTRR